MTPFEIDFRSPFPWRKLGAWGAVGVLTLASFVTGWALWKVSAETEALLAASSAAIGAGQALQARQRAAQVKPPYLEAMADLVRMSSFPLNVAIGALERVDVPGTRVIDLSVDAIEHRAIAIVEASAPKSMQAYLEGLTVEVAEGSWQLQSINAGAAPPDASSDRRVQTAGVPPSPAFSTSANEATGVLRATLEWRSKVLSGNANPGKPEPPSPLPTR